MRRWWLWIVLLLSLGVNAGILLTLALSGGSSTQDEGRPGYDRRPVRERSWRSEDGPDSRPDGRRHGEERILERLAERLELEGEQRERFFELQRGFFRQAFGSRQQGRRLQRELGMQLSAPEPDRQRIEELIDEQVENRRAMDRVLAETVLATRDLLDEPQESAYLDFLQRLRERMGRDGPRRRSR